MWQKNDFRLIRPAEVLGIPAAIGRLAPLEARRGFDPGIYWKTGLTRARLRGLDGGTSRDLGEVLVDVQASVTGEVVAGLDIVLEDGRVLPALWRDKGSVMVQFDLQKKLVEMACAPFAKTKAPFYVKLGLSPAWLPNGPRRIISDLRRCILKKKKEGAVFSPIDFLRCKLLEAAGAQAPRISERSPVLVRHDVDTDWCFKNGFYKKILDQEEKLGIKACWNFVTHLYPMDWNIVDEIKQRGHEIGFHDCYHDHRFAFLPENQMRGRYEKAQSFVERYGVHMMGLPAGLGTTAFYSAHPDWLKVTSNYRDERLPHPVFFGNLLEVPYTHSDCFNRMSVTLPMLSERWMRHAEERLDQGAHLQIATHPEPGLLGEVDLFELYVKFLNRLFEAHSKRMEVVRPFELHARLLKEHQTALAS